MQELGVDSGFRSPHDPPLDIRREIHVRPSRRAETVGPGAGGATTLAERGAEASRGAVAGADQRQGGVGTSNLALNLAIALGEYGRRVVLVDADLGLANIDLLCGLRRRWTWGTCWPGAGRWPRRSSAGPGGDPDRPRAHGADAGRGARRRPAAAGRRAGGAGGGGRLPAGRRRLGPGGRRSRRWRRGRPGGDRDDPRADLGRPTPTPRSGGCRPAGGPALRAVVNQAASAAEAADVLAGSAASSRQFLGSSVDRRLGSRPAAIPRLPHGGPAAAAVLLELPGRVASRGVRRLARALIAERGAGRRPRLPPRVRRHWFESIQRGPSTADNSRRASRRTGIVKSDDDADFPARDEPWVAATPDSRPGFATMIAMILEVAQAVPWTAIAPERVRGRGLVDRPRWPSSTVHDRSKTGRDGTAAPDAQRQDDAIGKCRQSLMAPAAPVGTDVAATPRSATPIMEDRHGNDAGA